MYERLYSGELVNNLCSFRLVSKYVFKYVYV